MQGHGEAVALTSRVLKSMNRGASAAGSCATLGVKCASLGRVGVVHD